MKGLVIHRGIGLSGGDVVMATKYAAALGRLIDADVVSTAGAVNVSGYDFVHMFAGVSPEWAMPTAYNIKRNNKPLIITPLYWPRDGRQKFNGAPPDIYAGYKQAVAVTLAQADSLACITMSELLKCWELVPYHPGFVMGCGVPDLAPDDKTAVKNRVVMVGRIERHKNQASVARACHQLKIELVCVGALADDNYAAEVAAWGAQLTGELSHAETLEMVAAARVFVNASFGEIVSQATLEAACLGVPCVITADSADPEYFGAGAYYCNPQDYRSIQEGIALAWIEQRRAWFKPITTWDTVARRVLDWAEENV